VEKAKNKRANFIMRQLYSEAVLYAGDLALLVCLVKMLQSWSDSARDGWHTDNTSLVGPGIIEITEGGLVFVIFYSESGDSLK